MFKKQLDYSDPDSLVIRLRKKRFMLFRQLIDQLPRPLKILDVGGTQVFWESMDYGNDPDISIVILNQHKVDVAGPSFASKTGDARNMSEFSDNEFDMVFSNSVIEHVGSWEEQQRMAQEVARVGKAYFVQTPNFYFPYEPHYRIPMFQFLPRVMKIWILQYSLVPHLGRHTYENAVRAVDWVRLLTRKEISRLFPEAEIYVERLWGLPKSYVAWHVAPHAAAPANGEAGTR